MLFPRELLYDPIMIKTKELSLLKPVFLPLLHRIHIIVLTYISLVLYILLDPQCAQNNLVHEMYTVLTLIKSGPHVRLESRQFDEFCQVLMTQGNKHVELTVHCTTLASICALVKSNILSSN